MTSTSSAAAPRALEDDDHRVIPEGSGPILTVDLGKVAANWRLLEGRVAPAACGAAVKADAYGLGAASVGPALWRAGARLFHVATFDEGVALQRALPGPARVTVLNGRHYATAEDFLAHRLVPTLNHAGDLAAWRAAVRRLGRPLPAIVQLETGMNRLGLTPPEIASVVGDPSLLRGIDVLLWMSHLACADEPEHPANAAQRARFAEALARLPKAPASLANSAGIFLGPAFHFDEVRPGAALYGLSPNPARPNPMIPVVRLEAPILQVREVAPPGIVGYGATRAVHKPMRLATIGLGYADGMVRALADQAELAIGGVRVPLYGRVSMDLATVDVSHLPEYRVHPGVAVEILGPRISADELASRAGTIGYEVLTGLGPRIRRQYIGGDGS
jgi:alanine racemase